MWMEWKWTAWDWKFYQRQCSCSSFWTTASNYEGCLWVEPHYESYQYVLLYIDSACHLYLHTMYAYSVYILLDLGELYTWGSNSFGQLGSPQVQRQTSTPERLPQEVKMCTCHFVLQYAYTYLLGFCQSTSNRHWCRDEAFSSHHWCVYVCVCNVIQNECVVYDIVAV